MKTLSTHDTIYIPPSPSLAEQENRKEILLYFIPGNPGLIPFYTTFLSHLATLLSKSGYRAHVVGHSLGGFEIGGESGVQQLRSILDPTDNAAGKSNGGVLGLKEQEDFVLESLRGTASAIKGAEEVQGKEKKVLLVGHSVGAYLMMQILARRMEEQMRGYLDGVEVLGGVGLFPTVVELAQSPRGRMAVPVATWTWFAFIMQVIASSLRLIPGVLVQKLVQTITGQTHKAAEVTATFLRSPRGVYQALHMARDELLQMRNDKWPSIVWDRFLPLPAKPQCRVDRPKLYFFWGENDYWIDNDIRDKIIAQHAQDPSKPRKNEEGKPHMETDSMGIPHDFCIQESHSEKVAEKVAEFAKDAIRDLDPSTRSASGE